MAYDIIKNNNVVWGNFSLSEGSAAALSRKEFFPLSTCISIEKHKM
jgi:hypothetical protein